MISEPDVTLTDYGLAIECAVLAFLLLRRGEPRNPLRIWFALFFGSVGVAAITGGTVHGFFQEEATRGYAILWPATLIVIGTSASFAWGIGARLLFSPGVARRITFVATAEFLAYGTAVLFVNQTFLIAVMNYLPAALFLLVAFGVVYARKRARQVLPGLVGMGLTFVAAWVQQSGGSLHAVHFNHNALYHAIQAVALCLIFWTARWLAAR